MSSGSNGTSKKKLIGFSFAFNGLWNVLKTERNFRIHLSVSALVILAGLFFGLVAWEWVAVITIMAIVIILEMINSVIERIMDFLSPNYHPLVGEIKDISAGAVLVAALASVIIACIIFLPKLF
ncbi:MULTISPECIES: diacylglycerol kinase family protein [Pontibacillus]|uniref:Diacylglycerol kinase family protein n=1 Tax=Pontibacillus chungwhensis TaxID=265426 RepID=A0ABY8UU15_9BACI|nr:MULTISPECIES: diacylglycerol kinase family protein [Pontibacillus]MCD5323611.1 diacylglycerol kinase family protein [Pontibacillus sp. HN14]WIF96979.1 diacylglycerol kinase family protein [Pontibacillus chungwhensis]